MRKLALALALAVVAAGSIPASALASEKVIVIPFEKEGFGHYLGTTTDGGNGTIEMLVTEGHQTGRVFHFTATLWLSYPDDRSLRAVLDGQLNEQTGKVVLNGRVVEGWLEGARVHEKSQLVDVQPGPVFFFEGTVQLMPGSAN